MKNFSFDLSYTASDLRIKSHWITFSIFISCISGGLLALFYPVTGIILTAILLFVMISLGAVSSSVPLKIYTLVRKITARFRSAMSTIILFVIYYGFIWPVSFAGSKLNKDGYEKAQTEWQPMNAGVDKKNSYSSGNYIKWVYTSDDWWLIFVYPFLLLLKLYGNNERIRSAPEDTYTLF